MGLRTSHIFMVMLQSRDPGAAFPQGCSLALSLQAIHVCIRPVLLVLSQCHLVWVGGSGSWCPEREVSWQDQDRGWSRPPAPPSAHVRLPVPRR